ncbi:ThuA domain-containing protein [Urbifossiella limnaea]|uniref:Trehalose utilization n=1 Tax=Urbifossiella limnaea TaxID=2528023 RepID=A0A517XWN6_9BACT|nr:ThuA domain-containing protein [Urbifossiella limnaea]QDU21920.1 Trehalose utilization [Urbifossiella limnaea]
MTPPDTRRQFLRASAAGLALPLAATAADPMPVGVVVWDERQPEQRQAYENFLGNHIADHLRRRPGLAVRSVGIEDAEKGLSEGILRGCDVLIWWGHRRQAEITPRMAEPLVARIKEGTLSLIALHSAHWATPFVEAMYERTRLDAARRLQRDGAKVEVAYAAPAVRYTLPKPGDRLTPYTELRKFLDGTERATVHLPYCCFPAYRTDGRPSQVRVLLPDHPIARGLPARFELPRTEMYAEPFHVPEPDEVVLEERWATGEWFRSGMVWTLGRGRVFYFRPGHETYPVFKEAPVLQLLENAVRWLAPAPG